MTMRISPLGDRALLCEAVGPVSIEHQRRIWSLAALAVDWPQVIETVPGVNNLMLLFDPLVTEAAQLQAQVESAWAKQVDDKRQIGRLIEIPVVYGGDGGPDLEDVARHAGLTSREVVRLHSEATYTVYCMGFQPGFGYMGGLDPRLATPRRATPRTAVPAGSVAIGGPQTAIYPARSPGGWNLIGHASVTLFDPAATPPTLLAAGDRVRFVVADILPVGTAAVPAVSGAASDVVSVPGGRS